MSWKHHGEVRKIPPWYFWNLWQFLLGRPWAKCVTRSHQHGQNFAGPRWIMCHLDDCCVNDKYPSWVPFFPYWESTLGTVLVGLRSCTCGVLTSPNFTLLGTTTVALGTVLFLLSLSARCRLLDIFEFCGRHTKVFKHCLQFWLWLLIACFQ